MMNERYRCTTPFRTAKGCVISIGDYEADNVLQLESRKVLSKHGFFYPENGGPQPTSDDDCEYEP